MKRHLLIILFAAVTGNIFATVHTVFYGTSTNVNCVVGDTVRFKDMSFTPTMVSINTTSGPVIITSPMFTTPDASGFIIDYVVTGNETAYGMNHSSAGSNGTITVNLTTGISSHINEETNIRIFPNPVVNCLNVSIPIDATFKLYDLNGQRISEGFFFTGTNTISVESLRAGVYFISIQDKKEKFIKE